MPPVISSALLVLASYVLMYFSLFHGLFTDEVSVLSWLAGCGIFGLHFIATYLVVSDKEINTKWSILGLGFPLGIYFIILLNPKFERTSIVSRICIFLGLFFFVGLPITLWASVILLREPWIEPIHDVDLSPKYDLLPRKEITLNHSCYYFDLMDEIFKENDTKNKLEKIYKEVLFSGYQKHINLSEEILNQNKKVFPLIEKAISAPNKIIYTNYNLTDDRDFHRTLEMVYRLTIISVEKDLLQNNINDAIARIQEFLHLATSISQGGIIYDHLTSYNIIQKAFISLRKISKSKSFNKEQSQIIIDFLNKIKEDTPSISEAIPYEYIVAESLINDFNGKSDPNSTSLLLSNKKQIEGFRKFNLIILNDYEKMKQNQIFLYKHIKHSLENPDYDFDLKNLFRVDPFSIIFKEDPIGFIISGLITPAADSFQEAFNYHLLNIDMTIAAITLELYKKDHQTYPQSLDLLIPDYIKELPIDFETGETLKYTVDANLNWMLYAVGQDGTDENGSHESLLNHRWRNDDYVLISNEIEFRKKEYLENDY